MQNTSNNNIAQIINALGVSRYVLICEHASKQIPSEYNNLGLSQTDLERHIGWDIGAQAVAEHLSALLNAPLIVQTCSRLLYDCNRPPSARSAIPEKSEQTIIPGNLNLTDAQKKQRVDDIYYPFHQSVTQFLDNRSIASSTVIVTIHSFNPTYNGQERTLDIGFINDTSPAWTEKLCKAGQLISGVSIAQNEPYSAADGVTHTLELHGRNRQLENTMIEIKNNLIDTADGQLKFAKILATLLKQNSP